MKFTEIESSDPFDEYLANTSPILDDREAEYLVRMRKTIKNSFADKLSILKGDTPLYNYDTDDQILRAKSHIYRIPTLLTPQLSFQIADKITEQHHKLLSKSLNKVKSQTVRCQPPVTQRVHSKFGHRTALKELENWFKTKLAEPDPDSDIYEHKNVIVGLGMKELIRLLKTRCHQEGQLLEDMWETTWKICQDVIRFLNQELGTCRKSLQTELATIEKVYVEKLKSQNTVLGQLNTQIQKLQADNSNLQAKAHKYLRSSKELKIQLAQEMEAARRYEKEYMRVLQENLALQMSNVDKREWVKKMYKSIKNYKARISEGMKSIIKNVVIGKGRFDGDLIQIDFDQIDIESILITEPSIETEAANALQRQFKTFNRYTQTFAPMLIDTFSETIMKQTENCAISTQLEVENVDVQTTEDWVSCDQLIKNNLKLKKQKDKLENQLKIPKMGSRGSRRGDQLAGMRSSHKSSLKGSQSDINQHCALAENNDDKHAFQDSQHNDLKIESFYEADSKASQHNGRRQTNPDEDNRLSSSKSKSSLGHDSFKGGSPPRQLDHSNQYQMLSPRCPFDNIPELPERMDTNSPPRNSNVFPTTQHNFNYQQQEKDNDSTAPPLSKFNFRLSLGPIPFTGSSLIDYMSSRENFPPITEQGHVPQSVSDQSHKCTTSRDKIDQVDRTQRFADPKMYLSGLCLNQQPSYLTTNIGESSRVLMTSTKQEEKKQFFEKSIMYRRCFSKPETVTPPSEPIDFSTSESELLSKLQKYNFQLLNRIKYLKTEPGYKDLLKNTGNQIPTSEKKMELSIDKGLVPVLVDLLKYYRKLKILKPHSAKIFLKNLQPLPVIIIRKFTQKYGVKSIAIKHLRQILMYLTILRNRNPRYGVLYLLLFSDMKVFSSDTLVLFITLLNALDGQHNMLKDSPTRDKLLENVELKEISIVEACQPYFTEPPDRPEQATCVGEYILYVLYLLLNEQSNKLSNVYWIFNGFAYSNIRLESFYRFVLTLNLSFATELKLLKQILSECDSRTAQGRCEMTEQKFVTFMTLNSCLTEPNLQKIISRYDQHYIFPINFRNLFRVQTNRPYQKRLIRYINDMIASNNTDCEDVIMAWKYLQFEEIERKMNEVVKDIIGKLMGFEERNMSILTGGSELFEVM